MSITVLVLVIMTGKEGGPFNFYIMSFLFFTCEGGNKN